jgi:hypothetical protein
VAETDHVQIKDFSDRELLHLIADLGNPISPRDLGIRIFAIKELEDNEKEIQRVTRCVRARFVWMRRYGLLDKHPEEKDQWLISPHGEALRKGTLSSQVSNGIKGAKEDSALALANAIGEKLVGSGVISGRAMQRELTFQINRRRAVVRSW